MDSSPFVGLLISLTWTLGDLGSCLGGGVNISLISPLLADELHRQCGFLVKISNNYCN